MVDVFALLFVFLINTLAFFHQVRELESGTPVKSQSPCIKSILPFKSSVT